MLKNGDDIKRHTLGNTSLQDIPLEQVCTRSVAYGNILLQIEFKILQQCLPIPSYSATLPAQGAQTEKAMQKSEFYHFVAKNKFDPPLSISEIGHMMILFEFEDMMSSVNSNR